MTHPINHFPAWMRTAVQQGQAISVQLSEHMTLLLYPQEKRYKSNFDLADIGRADIWHAQNVTVLPTGNADVALDHNVEEELVSQDWAVIEVGDLVQLEWAVLWEDARRQAESRDFTLRYGLARLLSWPDLAQLPRDIVAPVARICALVERKHTAGTLIPLIVDMPKPHAYALLYMLHLQGHIGFSMPRGMSALDAKVHDDAPPPDEPEALGEKAPNTSLIGKLWAKLTAVK